MIKVIFEIQNIDYDMFLEHMLQMIKEHPERAGGVKLPPFSAQMLKAIPKNKKNELVAQALNGSKEKLPQLEIVLSRFLGPVKIKDANINCITGNANEVNIMAEFYECDADFIADYVLPKYYSEEVARKVLGENHNGSLALSDVQNYIKQQDTKTKQLLIAKSMSANKAYLIQVVEKWAKTAGIEVKIDNIRFMVR